MSTPDARRRDRAVARMDGNSVYCAGERVFDPKLAAVPVIVLERRERAEAFAFEARSTIDVAEAVEEGMASTLLQGSGCPESLRASRTSLLGPGHTGRASEARSPRRRCRAYPRK
ncbi:hypothetical protein LOK46_17200 [Methylobacterium sp. NMS14P]|uniref:hypothetical protein n=1 Tax=Methylobacterium sp. NMS14P TaxID=2894310 RepID=UPI0023592111|nr:hypothetical protein [Methylobacterium sp. NMS14P]WCS28360.1 hypothetical protein LOK46_17200 [Methylobacterium sp. NMS14P]